MVGATGTGGADVDSEVGWDGPGRDRDRDGREVGLATVSDFRVEYRNLGLGICDWIGGTGPNAKGDGFEPGFQVESNPAPVGMIESAGMIGKTGAGLSQTLTGAVSSGVGAIAYPAGFHRKPCL